MKPRGLAILAVLVAVAVVAIVRLDRSGERSRAASDPAPLVDVSLEAVSRIDVSGATEKFALGRHTEGWVLEGPPSGEADPVEVDKLLRTVVEARVARVVEERPADAARYGLDPPERTVSLTVAGRSTPVVLRLGRSSPVAWQRYVTIDGGPVVFVDGSLGTALERTAASFREMRLLPVALDRVQRIAISDPERQVVIELRENEWWIQEPYVDRADLDLAAGIARAAASLRFERIEAERELGPAHRIAVRQEEGAAERLAEVAVEAREGRRFALRSPGRVFGSVSDHAAREFEGDPEALRERRLARFSTSAVREVRWTRDGASWTVRRAAEGGAWAMHAEGAQRGSVDDEKVVRLLDDARSLKFAFPLTPAARAAPAAEIVVSGEDGPLVAISFGGIVTGGDWAASSWRPGIAGRLDPGGWEAIARAAAGVVP